MSQTEDELATRAVLADLTAGQPAAPPDRYGAVRRRAVVHRRRRLAAIAAAVAVLAVAAVTIPLGLRNSAPPAPQSRSGHYRVTEQRPDPRSPSGLVASGTLSGRPWRVALDQMSSAREECVTDGSGQTTCMGSPTVPWHGGGLAWVGGGLGPEIYYGAASAGVAYLRIAYGNGQVVTARPVQVRAAWAPLFAVVAPYPAAVTRITAYSSRGELGYAIPFTRFGAISTEVWLRPGQPALPQPATYSVGSGTTAGRRWSETAYVGPWGFCYHGGLGDGCSPLNWLGRRLAVGIGSLAGRNGSWGVVGQTAPQVAVLVLTTENNHSEQIRPVADGTTGIVAYVSAFGNPVVRWAVYDAQGRELGSGRGPIL